MTAEQRQNYTELLRSLLGDYRYRHSLCVAEEAARLAKKYGADEEKAELAGLLHDIMKEADPQEQLRYIGRTGRAAQEMFSAARKLLHAPAGAGYIRRELGIRDRDVLAAVRYHTTGRAGMSLLEKVIFVADFTSADRSYHDVDVMRTYVEESLEKAMLYGVQSTITHLVSKGNPVHPDTISLYNELLLSGGR